MNTAPHPDNPKHIASCLVCQANARQEAGELGINLYKVWSGVAAEVWSPPIGPIEGWTRKLFRSPGLARALVTTPSLFLSWIGASAFVVLIGIIATRSTGTPWAQMLAPIIAAAGIAYAYGPAIDPAFELSRSMAISDRMILIVRALAVFGLNTAFGMVASLLASPATGLTLSWLAPMTAVAALALAVASVSQSPAIGVTVAIATWSVVVLTSQATTGDAGSSIGAALVPIYLLATVVCAAIVLYVTSGRQEKRASWG